MIKVRNLTKSYGPSRAIKDLNFTVNKGEVVGFLGPNGAGKTTTMKIITGFMAPSDGSVEVAGFDVFENPIEVKKRLGYLPETPPVYGDMYVDDYLAFVAGLKLVPKDKVKKLVGEALDKTGLGHVRRRMIQNLSKGYRQRVGIAQAIVSDPEILILDEPTVGLDPKQVAEIRQLIRNLAGHHTIILSTHILPEVQASCQRIIIIDKGTIVAEDTLEGLSKGIAKGQRVHLRVRSDNPELQSHLQAVNGVQRVSQVGNSQYEVDTEEEEKIIDDIATAVIQKGAGLAEIKVATMDLENIFLKLTGGEIVTGGQK